ncbi:MAG: WYL domain-containing protein [Desulfovibrionaceae bacterium]|nr:WYL domain-containing protein [Desulfovibrionaceae bacterium]
MTDKPSSLTTVENALNLYDLLLFSSKKYSAADLMAILLCPKTTVLRLLQQIEVRKGLEFHRETDDEDREWFWLDAPARRPRIVCSPEDFKAIEACVSHCAVPPAPVAPGTPRRPMISDERAAQLKESLGRMRLLFEGNPDVISDAVEPPSKSWVDLSASSGLLSRALQALQEKRLVRVTWQRRRSVASWTMAPTGLFASDDTLYLSGWHMPDGESQPKPARNASRPQQDSQAEGGRKPCFVCLHRLRELTLLDETHDLPGSGAGPQYFGALGGEQFRVRVRFEPQVADYVQDRHYSSDERFIPWSDGTLELEFTARSGSEVISWLLGYGSSALLLEPAPLVARLKEEVCALLARYGGLAVYPPKDAAEHR